MAQSGARREAWMARDLLTAMGGDSSTGHGRNYADTETLATVRLVAHGITDLLVCDAASLKPSCLTGLLGICAAAGVSVWLLHHPGTITPEQEEQLLRWTDTITPPAELREHLDALPAAPPDPSTDPLTDPELPLLPVTVLPSSDWTVLLEEVRRALPEASEAVEARWQYRRQAALALLRAAPDPKQHLRQLLLGLAEQASTQAELSCDLRATQAAAFTQGWSVRVDLTHLIAARSRRPSAASRTPQMWGALRRYLQPARPAAAALNAAGLSAEAIIALPISALREDGSRVTVPGDPETQEQVFEVEPAAREYLIHQRLTRLANGARADEPLLATSSGQPWKQRAVGDALIDISRDAGLLLTVRGVHQRAARDAHLYDQGIVIAHLGEPLTTPQTPPASTTTSTADPSPEESSEQPGPLLDCQLIRQRRLKLGMSMRHLADASAVSLPVIKALEAGTNHEVLPLGALVRIGQQLALTLDEMTGQARTIQPSSQPEAGTHTGDAATAGAALHHAGRLTPGGALASVLGWDRPRLAAAVDELDTLLPQVGLNLIRRDGVLGLVAAANAVAVDSQVEIRRARYAKDGMSVGVARMLHAALRHHLEGGRPLDAGGNAQRVALAELVNAGLLEQDFTPAACVGLALGARTEAGWLTVFSGR